MAFDPTTLFPGAAGAREGAILHIRPVNLWQDVAGTTAVANDGDPVRRIDDISVNGRSFIVFETTQPLVYHTDGEAHWLSSAGNTDQGMISEDSWSFMNASPYAVGAAITLDTPSAGDQYFFGTQPATGGAAGGPELASSVAHCGARTGSTATIAHWFDDSDFSHSFPTTPERHICEYTNPGSEYTIDGSQIDVDAATPSALDNVGKATVLIRDTGSGSFQLTNEMVGDIYGMIIVVDTITAQEKADIDAWLKEQIAGPEEIVAVGLSTDTQESPAAVARKSLVVGLSTEVDSSPAVTASSVTLVGLSTETDTSPAATHSKSVTVGLSTETDTSLGASPAESHVLGPGPYERDVSHPLSFGFPGFRFSPHDAPTPGGRAARRRLAPIIYTDRATGTRYVIVEGAGKLITLQAITPKPGEFVYPPDFGPTIVVDGVTFRTYVEGGQLLYERHDHKIRTRPVLFGTVTRPRARDVRYQLTLPDWVI